MKMRVADFITSKLYEAGGEHVFLITGGMIMHLTDALLLHKKQKYICCHHEQAAVMAADAYGRYTNKLGVAYVTAGPGALNTITGVVGAYVDSAPCVIVAGQAKVSQASVTGPRQFALQGFNNLPIFKHFTKYAVMLNDISKVRYEVEKSIHIAKSHRVGPVYIECPIDIQGAPFDPEKYEGYVPPVEKYCENKFDEQVELVKEAISRARRPCILAGAGVRLSGAIESLHKLIDNANIPVVTSRLGMDLIGYDHPLFVGRPGTYGDRPANFTIQNSDLLLIIGCRLGIGLISYGYDGFASNAKKIMVDIDENELTKPSVRPDIAIKSDAKLFIDKLIEALGDFRFENNEWIELTQNWKMNYPVDLPEYVNEKKGINSYHFIRVFRKKCLKRIYFFWIPVLVSMFLRRLLRRNLGKDILLLAAYLRWVICRRQ